MDFEAVFQRSKSYSNAMFIVNGTLYQMDCQVYSSKVMDKIGAMINAGCKVSEDGTITQNGHRVHHCKHVAEAIVASSRGSRAG